MSKKDYILLAKVFKSHEQEAKNSSWLLAWETLGRMMADELEDDNPRFDRHKFLVACGIEEE